MKTIGMLSVTLATICTLAPQDALAANIYVPFVCETSGPTGLSCRAEHEDAEYDDGEEAWVVTVDENDTVYFYVSDWTESSTFWSVTAETLYTGSGSAAWTKSGAYSESPPETPMMDFTIDFEATDGVNIKHGRRRVIVTS